MIGLFNLRNSYKLRLRSQCARQGIKAPWFASARRLKAIIDAYYKDAVIIIGEDGNATIRRTNKPAAKYIVEYTVFFCHTVIAESEEAARKWFEDEQYYDGIVLSEESEGFLDEIIDITECEEN